MATRAATPSTMDDINKRSFDLFFLLSLNAVLSKNVNLLIMFRQEPRLSDLKLRALILAVWFFWFWQPGPDCG